MLRRKHHLMSRPGTLVERADRPCRPAVGHPTGRTPLTRAELAELLARAAPDILSAYRAEPSIADSPTVTEAARAVLYHVADALRDAPRAAHPVSVLDPGETLRHAQVLFSATVSTLAGRLGGTDAVAAFAALTALLNDTLTRAAQATIDAQTGKLLDRVHGSVTAERRRLSRELHDRIGHGISVAQRSLELYEIYRESQPVRAVDKVRTAREVLAETVCGVRQVIGDLRLVEPMESLERAIFRFLELATPPGLDSRVEVIGDEAWAPAELVEETFLIIREALRNVIRHAEADRVRVRVEIAPGDMRAWVEDNGRGFDPAKPRTDGAGVLSMRERAAELGGTLTIASEPGGGTRLALSVSLTNGYGGV